MIMVLKWRSEVVSMHDTKRLHWSAVCSASLSYVIERTASECHPLRLVRRRLVA